MRIDPVIFIQQIGGRCDTGTAGIGIEAHIGNRCTQGFGQAVRNVNNLEIAMLDKGIIARQGFRQSPLAFDGASGSALALARALMRTGSDALDLRLAE